MSKSEDPIKKLMKELGLENMRHMTKEEQEFFDNIRNKSHRKIKFKKIKK